MIPFAPSQFLLWSFVADDLARRERLERSSRRPPIDAATTARARGSGSLRSPSSGAAGWGRFFRWRLVDANP
jgi:hypothetical protein